MADPHKCVQLPAPKSPSLPFTAPGLKGEHDLLLGHEVLPSHLATDASDRGDQSEGSTPQEDSVIEVSDEIDAEGERELDPAPPAQALSRSNSIPPPPDVSHDSPLHSNTRELMRAIEPVVMVPTEQKATEEGEGREFKMKVREEGEGEG